MSLNRTTTWMAAVAGVLLMALPASGQGLQDAQLFAPAEFSSYGGGVRPKEGFFFSFDYLHWSTSAPEGEPIGFPSNGREAWYGPDTGESVIQTNTMDTSIFTQQWESGERFEIGDRWRHHGWMVGTLRLKTNSSNDIVANGVSMVWDDPPFGTENRHLLQGYFLWPVGTPFPSDVPTEDRIIIIGRDADEALPAVLRELPVVFDDFKVENRNETWGVEAMYSYRTHPQRHGGFFEMYFGARYLEFNDLFSVDARNRIPGEPEDPVEPDERVPYWTPGAALANSNWSTNADNHIVGPQVALRWFKTSERWTFDTSGRFVAGFNNQNVFQKGTLGSEWYPGSMFTSDIDEDPVDMQGRPLLMSKSSFTHRDHSTEWSPIVELRVNLQYQVTRGISVRGGWTGMWIDGIARGSSLNVYRLPDMGLNMANNRQDVFIHGFNFGAQMNY
jgi:putative beta barrel porin BBP7